MFLGCTVVSIKTRARSLGVSAPGARRDQGGVTTRDVLGRGRKMSRPPVFPPLPWPHPILRRSDRPQQRVRVFDSTESHDLNLHEKPLRRHKFRQNQAPEFAAFPLKNQGVLEFSQSTV